jgi:hypothetical protein
VIGATIVGILALIIIASVKGINRRFNAQTGPGEATVAGGCGLIGLLALSIIALLVLIVVAPVLIPVGVICVVIAGIIALVARTRPGSQ